MNTPLLICDLDGTLVDSYAGIRQALQGALAAMGLRPAEALGRWIVGPPLDDILTRTIGGREPQVLSRVRDLFKQSYDGGACRLAQAYEGVDAMLHDVLAAGGRLALATNKRRDPTTMILESCGWQDVFWVVETVDSQLGSYRAKSDMLVDILRRKRGGRSECFYLGDTPADASAARQVGIRFLHAAWGGGMDRVDGAVVNALDPATVSRFIRSGGGRPLDAAGRQS